MNEYEIEPVPGLPEELPDGERLLWQGSPHWPSLWRGAFHARKLVAYFLLLALWVSISMLSEGAAIMQVVVRVALLAACACAAIALLAGLSYFMSRAAVYTITTDRVVMRVGLALPMAINLPFKIIESADVKIHADGTGDIPLRISERQTMGYAILWPHARQWRFARPEPMLRSIPDAANVAQMLADAMSASVAGTATNLETADEHRQSANADMLPKAG